MSSVLLTDSQRLFDISMRDESTKLHLSCEDSGGNRLLYRSFPLGSVMKFQTELHRCFVENRSTTSVMTLEVVLVDEYYAPSCALKKK